MASQKIEQCKKILQLSGIRLLLCKEETRMVILSPVLLPREEFMR